MNVKILFSCLIYILFQCAANVGFSKVKPSVSVFSELNQRKGVPNFLEKALRGDSIKVAYFGGSITAQNGWRVYSLDWFKQRFPKARFSEINAAIGGTGSDFGAFRIHDQVLKFKPDLVFVEFAVNDGSTAPEKIVRSMEGIVRQIWSQNEGTDICFIYTIKEDFLQTERDGQLPTSVKIMEKVANYYGIPSINFGFEVSEMVTNKQLIFTGSANELQGNKVFSPDGVHPYTETGHQIYFEALKRSFEMMASGKKIQKHKLPKPLDLASFSNAKMIDVHQSMLSKNWVLETVNAQSMFSGFSNYLTSVGKTNHTGETLTIHFKGKAIGAYDVMGPDAGRVVVEIDGIIKDTISRFDEYCTYRRMNYFVIDHLENKDHTVIFRVLADPFDKEAILSKRGEIMKNPPDFKENYWYVGKILIDGEISSK